MLTTTEWISAVAAVAGLAAVVVGALNAYHATSLKLAVAQLQVSLFDRLAHDKAELLEHLVRDKEDLRAWVNGSFMRASEVLARLAALEARL